MPAPGGAACISGGPRRSPIGAALAYLPRRGRVDDFAGNVDQAALALATVAAGVTLTGAPGPFAWDDTVKHDQDTEDEGDGRQGCG
jgi:hypothetical protein